MKAKRYIITGGPGSGKTALIKQLKLLGFHTRNEVARDLIEKTFEHGGNLLPWLNRDLFDKNLADISHNDYIESEEFSVTFFDGCMLDIVPWRRYLNLSTRNFNCLSDKYAFETEVFIVDPWDEIYTSDASRPSSFQDSVAVTQKIREFYNELNYKIITVPKVSPMERAKFILETLKINVAQSGL